LLFSNSSEVYSGKKGIYAPVRLNRNHFPSTISIRDLLESFPLRLSTAAFLSARFPYISPAGRLDSSHYFLDGGIVENSGAETALGIYQALEHVISKDTSLQKLKFQIYILSLKNSIDIGEGKEKKKLFELTAPISAALNAGGISELATKSDTLNKIHLGYRYLSMRPISNCPNEKIVLPLGWKISKYSLDFMYQSIYKAESNKITVRKICKLIKSKNCP
ncbi:MAG: hypothetical protein K2Q22_01415, partial [Cytophagales bacterium]|nr:hypothetical protein [Cytophagales bacterium]